MFVKISVELKKAIGTSAAIGFHIAVSGTLGFILLSVKMLTSFI